MATISFRTKEIGLTHKVSIKKNFRKMQDFTEIMQNANDAELHSKQRKLDRLKLNYPAKIADLKEQLKVVDKKDKPNVQNQLEIAETEYEIQQLKENGAQTDDGSEFINVATNGIIQTLELDDKDADKVRNSIESPEQLGNYLSYLNVKLGGGTDADYDELVKEHEKSVAAQKKSEEPKENLTSKSPD